MAFSGYMPRNGILGSYDGKTVRYIYATVGLVELERSLVVHSHKNPAEVSLYVYALRVLLDFSVGYNVGS